MTNAVRKGKSANTVLSILNEGTNVSGPMRYRMSSEATESSFANTIRNYWNARGYHVEIQVRDVPHFLKEESTYYRAVRSNLINGLPAGYKGDGRVRQ